MLWYNVQQEAGHNSQVRLPNGVHWEPESCWDNIYDAISDARVLCYVVGKPALLLLTITGTPYLLLLCLAMVHSCREQPLLLLANISHTRTGSKVLHLTNTLHVSLPLAAALCC